MHFGGTLECKQRIIEFVSQGQPGIVRLRELLPLIFDSHRILTREAQMDLLRACSLSPIECRSPWHHVTFETHPSEREPSTSWADQNPRTARPACVSRSSRRSRVGT